MNNRLSDLICPECNATNLSCRNQCWKCGVCLTPGHYLGTDGRPHPLATSSEIKELLDQATVLTMETHPTFSLSRLRFWARKEKNSSPSA